MRYFFLGLMAFVCSLGASGQIENVLDEVAWIVGDEPILKSDIEMQRIAAEYNRTPIEGDPYVTIPEELAIQKLFLHQAALDSIEVTEADVQAYVDNELQRQISIAGSERNLENGMAVSVGRLREDTQYTIKFVCMSHNTLRGAAGGAVLLAELLCAEGYMDR